MLYQKLSCVWFCGLVWSGRLKVMHHVYVETRLPIIWTGEDEYGRVEIYVDVVDG